VVEVVSEVGGVLVVVVVSPPPSVVDVDVEVDEDEVELVELVEDDAEVSILPWGSGKSSTSRPSMAAAMNRCQISAGRPPPVTPSIGVGVGWPTHTTAV
jgi:hypothetical protein